MPLRKCATPARVLAVQPIETFQLIQIKYTLGGHIRTNRYHIPILRAQFTRALPQLVPEVQEEVVDAFNEFIPLTSGENVLPFTVLLLTSE
jgi:hypothetical protein